MGTSRRDGGATNDWRTKCHLNIALHAILFRLSSRPKWRDLLFVLHRCLFCLIWFPLLLLLCLAPPARAPYVDRNPVRAGMVEAAPDYGWSSALAHVEGRGSEGTARHG